MKISFCLFALFAIAFFAAPAKAQTAGSIGNFCSFYSAALQVNNNALISLVVNETLNNILPGPLVVYFNGVKNNSLNGFNFLNNQTALVNLFNHLVQFFGAALNCTDGTIPAYAGKTMVIAHQGLQINYSAFATFNQYVLSVLTVHGVAASDVVLVANLLNSLNLQTCFAADCQTICNKYSVQGVMNNSALLNTIVVKTFTAAVNSNILLPFFNGNITYAGVQNYLVNQTAQNILVLHLVQFFGQALGCSDGSIGAYAGASLSASHVILPIGNVAFNTFNAALVQVLASLGVTQADQTAVAGVLESTRAQVCTLADCFQTSAPAATTKKADAGSLVPAVAMLAGALVANHLF